VNVLRHATSGNVTGDYASVVGYGAAVILKSN
jgi:AmmeMemoRadiSam system protein B